MGNFSSKPVTKDVKFTIEKLNTSTCKPNVSIEESTLEEGTLDMNICPDPRVNIDEFLQYYNYHFSKIKNILLKNHSQSISPLEIMAFLKTLDISTNDKYLLNKIFSIRTDMRALYKIIETTLHKGYSLQVNSVLDSMISVKSLFKIYEALQTYYIREEQYSTEGFNKILIKNKIVPLNEGEWKKLMLGEPEKLTQVSQLDDKKTC